MPQFTQADRPIAVTTPLGPDALLLRAVRGVEAVSQPFRFELDLLALDTTDVPFERVLNQPATVTMQANSPTPRHLNGIISELADWGPVAAGERQLIRYRAILVPRLALLAHTVRTRAFQQLTVPEILKQVLTGMPMSFSPQANYQPRDYCVQYRESDFAFASRLMEEEGIRYHFDHSEHEHTLVLSDAPLIVPKIAGDEEITYDQARGGPRDQERIWSWRKSQRLGPSKCDLRDYSFEIPDNTLDVTASVMPTVTVGTVSHPLSPGDSGAWQVNDYPGRFAQRFDGVGPGGADQSSSLGNILPDGERTVTIRAQELASARISVQGTSGVARLQAGVKFRLQGRGNADGSYVLTRVEHEADLGDAYTLGNAPDGPAYHNAFEAIPSELPLRPARLTPRPRAHGTYTGTVVGPSGEQIHCDKYGRIKVHFPWDAEPPSPQSSCWIRVAQPWAGGGWGAITLPRVGQEVTVQYEDGDPDCPIVVGSVYNGTHMPPYELPKYRTHAGLKTQSRNGNTEDYSGLTFEDYLNQEHVHLHSQRHMTHSAEKHFVQNVGGQSHVTIAGSSSRQIGGIPGINYALNIGSDDAIGTTSGSGGSGSGAGPAIGGLPSGSGRGGSDSSTINPQELAQDTDGPYYVSPAALTSGPASHIDMVMGFHTSNTVGLYSTLKFGTNQSTTINPLAIEDFFMVPSAIAAGTLVYPFIAGAIRNAMGASSVVIGANVGITYGRAITSQRGPNFTNLAGAQNPIFKLTVPFGSLYCGLVIAEMFLPMIDPDSKTATALIGGTDEVASLVALNIWAGAEAGCSLANYFGQLGETMTEASTLAGTSLLANNALAANLTDQTSNIAFWESAGSGSDDGPATQTHQCDSPYTIASPLITLLSSPEPDAEGATGILLQAGGTDGMNGEVLIFGTGTATLAGGEMATVQCNTEAETVGTVTIDCGAAGTIYLQSGMTKEPNCVTLSPEGISIDSLEEITATVVENSLSINPAEISLTAAESSILITPEGITLTCGPCSIAITPEGIVVNGLTLELSGDAEVSLSGALINIGP